VSEARIVLRHGDFRVLSSSIPGESIDLILTDPPFPKEYLPLYDDLGREAERLLKPGGLLVTLAGQMFLPDVMEMLGHNLQWMWIGSLLHKGGNAGIFKYKIHAGWKPILFYSKGPPIEREWKEDVLCSRQIIE